MEQVEMDAFQEQDGGMVNKGILTYFIFLRWVKTFFRKLMMG